MRLSERQIRIIKQQTVEPGIALRLQFLVCVVRKECQHLVTTDRRLFGGLFTLEQAAQLEEDPDLAERVEAFGSQQNVYRNRAAGLGVMRNTTLTERPVRSASGRFAETRRFDTVSKDNGLSLLSPIVTTCFSG